MRHMANNNILGFINNGNSVRIMHASMFPLARQNLSNCNFPNWSVDMVAGRNSVSAHYTLSLNLQVKFFF